MNQTQPRTRDIVTGLLLVCDVLFLVTLFILPVSWVLDPLHVDVGPLHLSVSWGLRPILAPVLLLAIRLAVRAFALSSGRPAHGILDHRVARKCLLSVLSLYVVVGLLEWCLVLAGFEVQMAPVVISAEDGAGVVAKSQGYSDPDLLWKLPKGEEYYGMRVNSLGYRDREVKAQKDEGVLRVINMGDSCTAHGKPPYSMILHDLLSESPPTAHEWEAFNMAVYGYSSLQGLRVFQTQAKALQPDVVTLYFGWNDHWLEMETDRHRMAVRTNPLYGKLYDLLKEKRLFMMAVKLGDPNGRFDAIRSERGFRVPPDEYRQVMSNIIAEIRSTGAYPVVITAPRRDANTYLEKYGTQIDYNDVHDQYVEITREIARACDADLLDLHEALRGDAFDEYFTSDGIHLTQPGLELVAREIARKIRAMAETYDMEKI